MKQKPTYKIAASLLSISFLAAACGGGGGGGGGEEVVLTFWKTFEETQNIQPLIDAYEDLHPNVRIEYTRKNVDGYEEDVLDALAAGQGPDIFSINNSWLTEYENKISPAPDGLFSLREYQETFVDVVNQDFTKDGKMYGTAMAVDSLALYYNKDLLGTAGIATPPKDWNRLSADVQRLAQSDRTGYFTRSGVAMGLSENVNRAPDILYLLMLQAGVQPWDQDKLDPSFSRSIDRGGEQVDAGREALEFYTSFANPISLNYNWNTRSDYSIDAFANGRAAYLYSYAYTIDTLKQKAPNLNYGIASVPQYDLASPSVNYANYWGEVVSNQSENKEVAWDFLKFITSRESLDMYYAKHKQPSSRRDLIELQVQDTEIGTFANANLTAKQFYQPDQARMDGIMNTMIDNVLLRGFSVDEALSEAEAQAAALTQDFE